LYHRTLFNPTVSSQKSDEVSGSKGGKRKFHDVWKSKQNLFSRDINKYGFTPTTNRKIKKWRSPLAGRHKWNWKSKFSWLIYDSSNNVNYVV
jgi:hypothetical protein